MERKKSGQNQEHSKNTSLGAEDEKEKDTSSVAISISDSITEKASEWETYGEKLEEHKMEKDGTETEVNYSPPGGFKKLVEIDSLPISLSQISDTDTIFSQAEGKYHFHLHKPTSGKKVNIIEDFQRRMSTQVHPMEVESEMEMGEIRRKLSLRMNAQVVTEKLKKRVAGDKSVRNFLAGKCKYLDCLPLKWPKKISRNTLFHDYIFFGCLFVLFISTGFLLSCVLHGYGYEYNLYAMGVLSTDASQNPHSLTTKTSLYFSSGILVFVILIWLSSVIIGTMGYYTANRHFHYWFVCLIGGNIVAQLLLGMNVIMAKEHLCKQVKPYMDIKLNYLVRNYYTASQVIRKTILHNYSPKFKIKDENDVPFRVRKFLDASLMDVVQTYYFCCGQTGFKDYLDPSLRYPISDPRYLDWKAKIPRSCCTPLWNRNAACSLQVPTNPKELKAKLFQEGCSSKMDSICKNVFFYLGRGMLWFSAWQGIFFFISLLCIVIQIRQIKRLERSSRFKLDPKIIERPLRTRLPRNSYDQAERNKETLEKTPNCYLLPKWYKDFLESYRTHRGQYIYNRIHAARFGFEPQSATSMKQAKDQKLSLPLEKSSAGDNMPIATFIKPEFTKRFKEQYSDIRNKVVLSCYDRDINQWVTDIGSERKEKYNPDELAIVQYNESDWEEKTKRKLLIESDVLAKYHDWGKSHPPKPKQAKKIQRDVNFVPFKRKPGSPMVPSYMKGNWYSPKTETTSSHLTDEEISQSEEETATLSELSKVPGSVFHKPNDDKLKREKEQAISWRIGKVESLESIPQKKVKMIYRKPTIKTIQFNKFLAREKRAYSPPKKKEEDVIEPMRVNYLEYKKPRPLKPAHLKDIPSKDSITGTESLPKSLSQQSVATTRSIDPKSSGKKSEVYYTYPGEELFKAPRKRKQDRDNEALIINPKSKVPFDTHYYRQEKKANMNRQFWEKTQTTHIGNVPEKTEQPKSYVNRRVKKWEEKAKQFKW